MEVEFLKEHVELLEREIACKVSAAVEAFKAKTGVCPAFIHIDTVETTAIGDRYRMYTVIGAKVNLDIF